MNFLAEYEAQFEQLNKRLTSEWEELELMLNDEQFRIVALGLYNQGKSTLLNQLVNDYANSTFKVSDIRETRKDMAFSYDHSLFIDTPGLNAEALDDEVAIKAQQSAHLYLFVHKITTGELNAQEMAFLEHFAHKQGLASFFASTIFVLSNIASTTEEQVSAVQGKIKEQLCSYFGPSYDYKIMAVDSLRYAKGHLEHKELFINKSGINELKEAIAHSKEQVLMNLEHIKAEKFSKKLLPLTEALNSFILSLTQEVTKQAQLFDDLNEKYLNMLNSYQEQEELTYNVDDLLSDISFLTELQENGFDDDDDVGMLGKKSHCYDIIDRIDNNELKLERLRQSMIDEFGYDPSCDFECEKLDSLSEALEAGEHILEKSNELLAKLNKAKGELKIS